MSRLNELFDQLTARQADKKLPPVQRWNPERTGRIDIVIARDGTWYHEGEPIRRQPLVNLFATVLRRDPDGYCLVTPAEKLLIDVADAPFLAVDMEMQGAGREARLLFSTNVDDHVVAGAGHPLWVEDQPDGPRPYVEVRDGLTALLTRPVFYRLVDLAIAEGDELVVYSDGQRFPLGSVR